MITIETQPVDFGRVYDTNRLMYKFSSTNYTNVNFRFYISVGVGDITQDPVTYTSIGIVRKRPLSDGTCFFNPAELWSNYLTYDLDININELKEALNSNSIFKIAVGEEYGTTPVLINASIVEGDPIMLYNGIQEYIPYDITAYGGGNGQWVMSGTTLPLGWIDKGDWSYKTSAPSTYNVFFDDAIVDGITGVTDVYVSYTGLDGDMTAAINSISAGDYVMIRDFTDIQEYVIFKFSSQTQTPSYTTWHGFEFYETGSTMSPTGFSNGQKISIYALNTSTRNGYGKFLTDALDFQVDTYDYANLYFISSKIDRPAYCRVKVFYWSNGLGIDNPSGGGGSDLSLYTNNSNDLRKSYNTSISAPIITGIKPPDPTEDPGDPEPPIFKYTIASYYTGYTLTYTNTNNQMYYIPTGPKELDNLGMFSTANSQGGWVSYQIDLTTSLNGSSKVYNLNPMTYYRKSKCDKYDPIRLFWLNPHGGFDSYTFYKKNYVSYDIERTMWEHRFSDTYVLGERGSTVYKTKAVETTKLNTDWLTASESQILSQLEISPEVYATYEYRGTVYKIPYVINDTKFDYKQIKNEKMVAMEINITPAWNRISQTS